MFDVVLIWIMYTMDIALGSLPVSGFMAGILLQVDCAQS
jgi:hypothetical protein